MREQGVGLGLYTDDRSLSKVVVSFGRRDTDIPGRFPSSNFGALQLEVYVLPGPAPEGPKVSPVKAYLDNPDNRVPQVPTRLWSEEGSRTEHPGFRR
jgi:hypothetical protein